jgi:hypothetical protein
MQQKGFLNFFEANLRRPNLGLVCLVLVLKASAKDNTELYPPDTWTVAPPSPCFWSFLG